MVARRGVVPCTGHANTKRRRRMGRAGSDRVTPDGWRGGATLPSHASASSSRSTRSAGCRDVDALPESACCAPGAHRSISAVSPVARRSQVNDRSAPRRFRDHVIFEVALGTGLREHEIAALDVGDVLRDGGCVRHRIARRTFKRSGTDLATQEVFIADSNLYLERSKAVGWPAGAVALRRSGRTSPAASGTLNG